MRASARDTTANCEDENEKEDEEEAEAEAEAEGGDEVRASSRRLLLFENSFGMFMWAKVMQGYQVMRNKFNGAAFYRALSGLGHIRRRYSQAVGLG